MTATLLLCTTHSGPGAGDRYHRADEAGPMNAPDPAPTAGASPALAAFLRGIGRRALLFADLQAGPGGDRALAAALPGFVGRAASQPMSRWPERFWAQLLASPALRAGAGGEDRTAALLWLVAGLDEDGAAAALGVSGEAWRGAVQRAAPRDASGQVDAAAWQAWAESVRGQLRELPQERLDWWDRECAQAMHPVPRAPAATPPTRRAPRWVLPALWTGVALCALGLVVTFVPWRPQAGDGVTRDDAPMRTRGAPLPAPAAPAATYDADFALHHDRDLALLAGGDEVLLRDLDFHAWHAAQLGAAPAPVVPVVDLPPVPMPERMAAWQALPAVERALLRERWDAWQHLPAAEQAEVRNAVATFSALAPEQQQELRMAFSALPYEERRGWLLGPRLGQAWPRLQSLLMQVPAAQREPLLAVLYELSALQLDDLATLAQRTPPQERDALRRELLSTAAANRTAWLRERLRR